MTKPSDPASPSDAATRPAARRGLHRSKQRKRSPWKKQNACLSLPPVERFYEGNTMLARVPLSGTYGKGRWMILNHDAWESIRQLFGRDWYLAPKQYSDGKPTSFSVRTGRRDAYEKSIAVNWTSGVITLSRWLVNATKPYQHVVFRDSDYLNLRRSNLTIREVPIGSKSRPA